MYRIIALTAIVVLGCSGCTKPKPQPDVTIPKPQPYVTKSDGDEIVQKLAQINTTVILVVEKVNDHEARLTAMEKHSLAQSSPSGSLYLLNTQAEIEPVSTMRIPRTPYLNQPSEPAARTTVNSTAPGTLPEDDLAIKFGKFKQDTEEHFVALDATQQKQGKEIEKHSSDLAKLTGEVKHLTELVEGFSQATERLTEHVKKHLPPLTPAR